MLTPYRPLPKLPASHCDRRSLPLPAQDVVPKRLPHRAAPAAALHSPIIDFFILAKAPIMTLSPEGIDLIFRNARTHNGWQQKPVSDEKLRKLYELMLAADKA